MSAKRLTKELRNVVFLMEKNISIIPDKKYIKYFSGTTRIYSWKSNGMSEESIENITKSNSLFTQTFVNHYILPDVNFNGNCLINNNISIPNTSNKSIYFLHVKSMVKRFNYRFWIK